MLLADRETGSPHCRERESGIELLKIFAMVMIVVSHVSQTFISGHPGLLSFYHISECNEYFVNLKFATSNMHYLIIALFRHFGALGNDIFFICSAWFLIDSHSFKGQKIIQMLLDVWLVSVCILGIFYIFHLPITGKQMIKSFFPTTFANNWYITLYVIIYAIHPYLNKIIDSLSKSKMLVTVLWASFLYLGLRTIKPSLFFGSELITYIVIYFDIAYIKRYLQILSAKCKLNVTILVSTSAMLISLVIIVNYLGLKHPFFTNKLLYFDTNQDILIVLMAFSLFNIFRHNIFVNRFINYISSLTLFIYLIHENLLVREILRPLVFVWIKDYLGYEYIVLWVLLFALVLFVISILLCIIYKAFAERVTKGIASRIYAIVMNRYEMVFHKITNLR